MCKDRCTASIPAVDKHKDAIGREFLFFAIDAKVIQILEHRLTLIVLHEIALQDDSVTMIPRLSYAYHFKSHSRMDLIDVDGELILDSLHLNEWNKAALSIQIPRGKVTDRKILS